ncbi:MAG TPA: hypothetical protein VF781_03300 [Solirubrobacteraceae bacterium]
MKTRSRRVTALRLLWPLGVLLMTPVVLLSGVVALLGVLVIEAGRHLPAVEARRGRAQLAPVVHLDSPPATDSLSNAA